MTQHPDDTTILRYFEGGLAGPELLAADDHLASCEDCRRRLAKAGPAPDLRAALRGAAPGPFHLSEEMMERAVDGALENADREIVETHLADCPGCRSNLEDLRAFASGSRGAPAEPGGGPAAPVPFRKRTSPEGPAIGGAWPVLRIAAIFALSAALFWLLLRDRKDAPQVAENPGPGGATQGAPAPLPPPAPGPVPAPLAQLADLGGAWGLDAAGRLTAPRALDPATARLVEDALHSGKARTPPAVRELIGAEGVLLGEGDDSGLRVLAPLGTVVLSDRPEFRWKGVAGATAYVVAVYDASFHEVARSPGIRNLAWTPAAPLPRGPVLTWQVSADRGGETLVAPAPPAPEARFRVIEADAAGDLSRLRGECGGSHLVMGIAFARAGLLDEAERELSELLLLNPDSPVARDLLASARSLRASDGPAR